jgi:hydroxyacylglutathione hydrolase
MSTNVVVETFPVGPLGCNCSIVADPVRKQAVVVDPGGDLEEIERRLSALGVTVASIVHTHTHIDHVGATAPLQRKYGAPARIHEADRFLYGILPLQAMLVGVAAPEKADMSGDLVDGVSIDVGDVSLGALHTPGHTPGSVSFLLGDGESPIVFTGDTLFRGGIGRTDLWGGDSATIQRSLRQRLLTLDETTRVIAGHGPSSTIGRERRDNPFLRA